MPRSRSFSIRLLMMVILLVAVDFAIVRTLFWGSELGIAPGMALVTLPMFNLLLLTSPRLRHGQTGRFSWVAFAVVGWMLVIAVGFWSWMDTPTFFAPIIPFEMDPPKLVLGSRGSVVAFLITLVLAVYTPPQLLLALLAGVLAGRYYIIIKRKPDPGRSAAA